MDEPETLEPVETSPGVHRRRQQFASSPVSAFVREMQGAMQDYGRMRSEGVSREDACRGLETILRARFPLTKFPPQCDECDDLGRVIRTCSHYARCGRQSCAEAHPAYEHSYAQPCACPRGDPYRPHVLTPEDMITAATRTQKRSRSFRRLSE